MKEVIDIRAQPWFRLPTESSRAYAAFEIYRDQGPTRSLLVTAKEYYGPDTKSERNIQRWSSEHNWVERCRAFDEYESEQRLLARERARDEARQVFVDHAVVLAKVLVALAMGGKEQRNKSQVQALKDALDRAGVQVPKEIKISGDRDAPLGVPPALWDASLAELAAMGGIDLPDMLTSDEEE